MEPFAAADRKLFIEQLARKRRAALPSSAVERIASCPSLPSRVLQGIVNAAIAFKQRDLLDMRRLDADLTRIAVSDVAPGVLEDREVLAAIARHFETTFADLVGRSRKLAVARARAVAVATLKQRGRSLAEISALLDHRDPSTVSELATRGAELIRNDEDLGRRLAG